MFVSGVQKSDSVIYICLCIYILFFFIIDYYKILGIVLCAIQFIYFVHVYFTYKCVYILIPNSQFTPLPSLFLLLTMSLFSKSVSLFLLYKFICITFLDSVCKHYHMIFVSYFT